MEAPMLFSRWAVVTALREEEEEQKSDLQLYSTGLGIYGELYSVGRWGAG
jgi:hypothetical protein